MFSKDKIINSPPRDQAKLPLMGEGCLFEGGITSPSTRIDGQVRENFKGEESLIIGEKGVVSDKVKASEVLVYGKIEGNVESPRLEIKKDAKRRQGFIDNTC